jgi:hypothetical protein
MQPVIHLTVALGKALKNDDRKETNKEHAVGMFLIGELGEIWVS